jgi:hypothetical protein
MVFGRFMNRQVYSNLEIVRHRFGKFYAFHHRLKTGDYFYFAGKKYRFCKFNTFFYFGEVSFCLRFLATSLRISRILPTGYPPGITAFV